jgi:hypothetical protein
MENPFIRSKKKVEDILLNLRHKQQQSKFELPRRFSIQQPTREHLLIGESTRRYLESPYSKIESLLLNIAVFSVSRVSKMTNYLTTRVSQSTKRKELFYIVGKDTTIIENRYLTNENCVIFMNGYLLLTQKQDIISIYSVELHRKSMTKNRITDPFEDLVNADYRLQLHYKNSDNLIIHHKKGWTVEDIKGLMRNVLLRAMYRYVSQISHDIYPIN